MGFPGMRVYLLLIYWSSITYISANCQDYSVDDSPRGQETAEELLEGISKERPSGVCLEGLKEVESTAKVIIGDLVELEVKGIGQTRRLQQGLRQIVRRKWETSFSIIIPCSPQFRETAKNVLTKVGHFVSRVSLPLFILQDSYHLGQAAVKDNGLGKNFATTGASIAGSWAGSYGLAYVGEKAGSFIGALVGGPVGAAVGGITGGIVGSLYGATKGSVLCEHLILQMIIAVEMEKKKVSNDDNFMSRAMFGLLLKVTSFSNKQ